MSIVINVHLVTLEIRMKRVVHVLPASAMAVLIPTIRMLVTLQLESVKNVYIIEHLPIVLSVPMDTMKRMVNVFHVYAMDEDQLMLCVINELANVHVYPMLPVELVIVVSPISTI